jgi:hypothetical protein
MLSLVTLLVCGSITLSSVRCAGTKIFVSFFAKKTKKLTIIFHQKQKKGSIMSIKSNKKKHKHFSS